mmetsp:Transcript_55038/g.156471  ORF Transcript_55038/g.156471 Transcript_55038/m.156471 type:complete len:370 (+) Transcript_55038:3-1112(+)
MGTTKPADDASVTRTASQMKVVQGDAAVAPVGASGAPSAPGTFQRFCLTSQLRKTKICMYHIKGICKHGADCVFAHSCTELQSAPDLRRTKLCQAFLSGFCNTRDCTFAHGEEELRATNLFHKKTLCLWNQKGKCRNGGQCRFAHGVDELRSNPSPPLPAMGAPPSGKKEAKPGSGAGSCGAGTGTGRRGQDSKEPVARTGLVGAAPLGAACAASPMQEPMKVHPSGSLTVRSIAEPLSIVNPTLQVLLNAQASGAMEMPAFWSGYPQGSMSGEDIKMDFRRLQENVTSLTKMCQQIQAQIQAVDGSRSAQAAKVLDRVELQALDGQLDQERAYMRALKEAQARARPGRQPGWQGAEVAEQRAVVFGAA